MLKINKLADLKTIIKKIKNNPLVVILFCLLLSSFIILEYSLSKFLLFLENNFKTAKEVEAAPLTQKIQNNQMTQVIEDGFLKK